MVGSQNGGDGEGVAKRFHLSHMQSMITIVAALISHRVYQKIVYNRELACMRLELKRECPDVYQLVTDG